MKIYAGILIIIWSHGVFAATITDCVDDKYNVKSCSNPNRNGRIKNNPNKPVLNWDVLNLKQAPVQYSVTNAPIEITQSDVSQLASAGNSWVVFGGSNDVMNMNIGVANNSSPQTWSLPSNFQNYFDYYTQDDFVSPSSVPVHLRLTGATNITKSTYVDQNDEEFEVYEHFNLNSGGVSHLGRSFDSDIDDDAFDEPDYEFMDVPLSLGDVMNNTIDEYDYETDQLLYRYTTTLTVDAYGSITIPGYGTYDCLRGYYQTQFYSRTNESSPFVLKSTFNSIGFVTTQGHFFQAKIVSQNGSNAVLDNLGFKAIVPTTLLSEPSDVKLNNDSRGVSINTTNAEAHPSAILDIDNDSLGILIPRILEANRPSSPAEGLLVYQVDNTAGFYYFDGTAWNKLSATPSSSMLSSTVTPAASLRQLTTNDTVAERSRSQKGKNQLQNGTTFIKFEQPQDDFEDLIINIQLEGDCNGVYISRKTREGFEVKELQKGKSNVKFSWSIK